MSKSIWQKSSFSGASNECIEVRVSDELVELRESDDGGVILHTTPPSFAALLGTIKTGELDHA
ncbi:DUF397 domain-containing protein [Kitasatospora sp. MBT66]|uniref:DUF397 domain-containing protein n=1 Tax=Kitasatospora sp. MBT66 TaxID=1444769 RepID=UPI0005B89702|nr:DUF397 domain-containing protein [Kitasatospora sp. MBT66]